MKGQTVDKATQRRQQRQMGIDHSQMSKERQPAVLEHWLAQADASYEAMLIQFNVDDVAFCAMAAWLLATRL